MTNAGAKLVSQRRAIKCRSVQNNDALPRVSWRFVTRRRRSSVGQTAKQTRRVLGTFQKTVYSRELNQRA